MRKLFIVAALVASFASLSQAQSDESRAEFFAGYSLLRTDVSVEDIRNFGGSNDEPFKNLNGFNVAATGYLTERFGITGDFSAHFETEDSSFAGAGVCVPGTVICRDFLVSTEAKARSLNFLGGPQVRFTNSTRVTPFVRALAGVQNNRLETEFAGGTTSTNSNVSSTDFALALGGGLDVRVSDRVAIRAFQIDYNPVFAGDQTVDVPGFGRQTFEGERTDNVRFSIGVVFK